MDPRASSPPPIAPQLEEALSELASSREREKTLQQQCTELFNPAAYSDLIISAVQRCMMEMKLYQSQYPVLSQ
jgi:hypothetical protein